MAKIVKTFTCTRRVVHEYAVDKRVINCYFENKSRPGPEYPVNYYSIPEHLVLTGDYNFGDTVTMEVNLD